LVMGCGSGHDAAYFARLGHVVTAVDISEEAVQRARANYGDLENLKVLQADAFHLPDEFKARFDLVFEHTCYCAISPERRNELVKVWRRALVPGGDLLGVFFVNEMRSGPPFGGSEWELRERLKADFNFLFWTRWRHSLEKRKSKELVIYAKRR
jgi:SAM-dependent methyltransferase